jgi:hypothetical protein
VNEADFELIKADINPWWRPRNETPEDREREEQARVQIAAYTGCDVRKVPDSLYGVDWSMWRQGELVQWGEFKWRGHERYPSLLIGCAKVWKLIYLFQMTGVSSCLYVRWNDGLWECPVHGTPMPKPEWGGRGDRGQLGDMEPCYKIDMRHFKKVCE